MKTKALLAITGLFTIILTGCSKDPLTDMTAEESRIYITDYDQSVNFSGFNTFSISDSVAVIDNGQVSKQSTSVDLAFIDAVKREMQARGYQLVNKSANPDLGINVNRIINTSTGIISYDSYYDYYGGYWDPYYWGYGGYNYYTPYSYATYTIREGALSIDALNLRDAAATSRINIIWTGLIRGSGIFNANTAAQQVNLLFNQSPYFKKN